MAINMNSVMGKVNNVVSSKSGTNRISKSARKKIGITKNASWGDALDAMNRENAIKAADALIKSIDREISTSWMDFYTKDAINHLEHDTPERLADGTYRIHVYFAGDQHRESLYPRGYPNGIDNLVELYNNGVDHIMNQAFGYKDGVFTFSRTYIPGAFFIENGIMEFMNTSAQEYGVIGTPTVNWNYSAGGGLTVV